MKDRRGYELPRALRKAFKKAKRTSSRDRIAGNRQSRGKTPGTRGGFGGSGLFLCQSVAVDPETVGRSVALT